MRDEKTEQEPPQSTIEWASSIRLNQADGVRASLADLLERK